MIRLSWETFSGLTWWMWWCLILPWCCCLELCCACLDSSSAESCWLPHTALTRLCSTTNSSFHLFKLNTRSLGCRRNSQSLVEMAGGGASVEAQPSTIRGCWEHRASPVSPHSPQLPKILLEIATSVPCKHVKNYLPASADVNPHKFVHQPYSQRTAA